MAHWPSGDRRLQLAGRASGTMRFALYTALVAGLGIVIYLGSSLAIMAGSPDATKSSPTIKRNQGGALVICGGGRLPDKIRDRFLELAGGSDARIVVIPTAGSYADRPDANRVLEAWKSRGVTSVQLLHTRSRAQADDLTFVKPLAEATGVWIGGGLQSKLTDAYLGTEVERQLQALLARGGVIGGTSAGAAVMSRVMISGGKTEAKIGEGFGFLTGAVVDQHFLKRNRMKRLVGVVRLHPDLIGFGIDESTALVVDVQRQRFSVVGDSYVVACVPETISSSPAPMAISQVSSGGTAIARAPRQTFMEILKPGDEADLSALKGHSASAVVSAVDFDAL